MEKKDKGKRKVIQPIRYPSSMSISSDEEGIITQKVDTQFLDTNKMLQEAISSQKKDGFNSPQAPQYYNTGTSQYTHSGSSKMIPNLSTMIPHTPTKIPTQRFTQSSRIPDQQPQIDSTISFGTHVLQKCLDPKKKFRPMIGTILTEKQQCLLDNIWHIQTMPQATTFKVQVLNALSIYFSEQSQIVPEKQPKRFSHYIIFRGTKTGIFNKWDTVQQHIQCNSPLYKGYHSFSEAMKKARETFGVEPFFIEPEEVKTFAEIAKTNPEQFIKAQESVIAQLQEQLLTSGKNTHKIQTQIENSILKQKNEFLEAKNTQLIQKLEKNETHTEVYRDLNSFRARILDTPIQFTMKPLFEKFPEFENMVSDKVRTEFPLLLYKLQQDIIDMAFGPPEKAFKGVKVVQRLDGLSMFFLQINLKTTNMPDDQILCFYHNGMIDYINFSLNSKTEALLNRFGEKFILTAGNMASHSVNPQIGCKILASFPEASSHTYRPSRKRIFLSQLKEEQESLKQFLCTDRYTWWTNKDDKEPLSQLIGQMIKQGQETPRFPINLLKRPWGARYRLIAEGHYTQIFAQDNWIMIFPFLGEDESSEMLIENLDDRDEYDGADPSSPQSIDSTHRDF